MPDKRDFLAECNEFHVPLADFQQQFCDRCRQPECTRSGQIGKSLFDRRVNTWLARLFTHVPQMPQGDPRWDVIQHQQFQAVEGGPVPNITWETPGAKEVPVAPETPIVVPKDPVVAKPVTPLSDLTFSRPRTTRLLNTPAKPGIMLNGPGVSEQKKEAVSDPWAKAVPEPEMMNVVLPGARIKLGGSGVK